MRSYWLSKALSLVLIFCLVMVESIEIMAPVYAAPVSIPQIQGNNRPQFQINANNRNQRRNANQHRNTSKNKKKPNTSYRGGNAQFGDFGGFNNLGSNSTATASLSFSAGIRPGNLKNGCGLLDMFSYMKFAFNGKEILSQIKKMLISALAKWIIVQVLGALPALIGAYEFLQQALNIRFTAFDSACSIGDLVKEAKNAYSNECEKRYAGNDAKLRECHDSADPMKPLKEKFNQEFALARCFFGQDPINSLSETICGKGSPNCFIMDMLPRFQISMSGAGQTCKIANNKSRPALIGFPILIEANMAFARKVNETSQKLWGSIRKARQNMSAADYEIIVAQANAKLADKGWRTSVTNSSGQNASLSGGTTGLALADVHMLPSQFGAGGAPSSEKLLQEYESEVLMCPDDLKRNPFLGIQAVYAAMSEDKTSGSANIPEPNYAAAKVDMEKFFDNQNSQYDPKTIATMMEHTFNCILNRDVRITAPSVQMAVAINSPVDGWDLLSSTFGQNIACLAVDNVGRFLLRKAEELLVHVKAGDIKGLKIKNTDTSTNKEPPSEAVLKEAVATAEALKAYIENQLQANDIMCKSRVDLVPRLRDFFKTIAPQSNNGYRI